MRAGHGGPAGEPAAVSQHLVDGHVHVWERRARLDMIRAALHDCVEAADEETTAFLLRSVVLLTSPMAWLYWKDYLGLDPEEAAATAGWAITTLASAVRQPPGPRRGTASGHADAPHRG